MSTACNQNNILCQISVYQICMFYLQIFSDRIKLYLSFGIINFRLAAGKSYHSWPSVKILMFVMFSMTIRFFKLFFCSDAYC